MSETPWRPASLPDFRTAVVSARVEGRPFTIENASSRGWGAIAAWGTLAFAFFLLNPPGEGSMVGAEALQMGLILLVLSLLALRFFFVPVSILAHGRIEVRNPLRTYDLCLADVAVAKPFFSYGRITAHGRTIVVASIEHSHAEAAGQETELRYAVEDARKSDWSCRPPRSSIKWTRPTWPELLLWVGWAAYAVTFVVVMG